VLGPGAVGALGSQHLWAVAETLAPLSGLHRNQGVELDCDVAYKPNRRRMVGDLKIHYTCSGNDDDILNDAKQLWPRVGEAASVPLPGFIRQPGWLG
jgi:hypothetical protein